MIDYLAHVRADGDVIVAAARTAPTAPVEHCPGWDVAALAKHLGRVQRWCAAAVVAGAQPDAAAIPRPDEGGEADYLAASLDELLAALASKRPDDPTWIVFAEAAPVVGSWRRRMAHETSIHRWDVERALRAGVAIDPALAADGVDEVLTIMQPQWNRRPDAVVADLGGELHLHANDVDRTWTIAGTGDRQATIAAPSDVLQLLVWGRVPLDGVSIAGDRSIAAAWYGWPRG
jgi:uncharacterized protein (TIGR03083 family)